nr:hypothetical protein GCM10025699_60530 [Microbacterium flavescens]
MLAVVGHDSVESLVRAAVPDSIHAASGAESTIPAPIGEKEALAELRSLADRNRASRTLLGLGYYDTVTPAVIQRNVLENPSWYTAYTPYQPEISQGRLEALINFQTMVAELTGLTTANASMLDEGTAVVEGMLLARRASKATSDAFVVDSDAFPQTKALLAGRAAAVGIRLVELDLASTDPAELPESFGLFVQYPAATGSVRDLEPLVAASHAHGGLVVVAADLLALTLLRAPASSAPTSPSAPASASACRWASAVRTRATWRCAPVSSGSCPGAWSASRRTPTDSPRTGSACRPGSSTSAARRPRRTSAPPRCCWP